MSNRRKQIEDYEKEPTKAVTLLIPISHWQLLETFAEATHRPINDVVSDVFSDTAIVSIRRMLASNAKPSQKEKGASGEPAVSGIPALAAAELIPPLTPLSNPPSPRVTPADSSARRPVENPAVNDPTRNETPRSQQPTNPAVANPSRPPQAPTMPPSAVSQPVPPLNRSEPLPPTPFRPVMPPSAQPPSQDSERRASAANSTPRGSQADQ